MITLNSEAATEVFCEKRSSENVSSIYSFAEVSLNLHTNNIYWSLPKCSEKFRKIHRKTPNAEFLFKKIAGLRPPTLLKRRLWQRACNVIKKDALAQVFSYEFCKISKNTLFTEHLR